MKILVTIHPFGEKGQEPQKLLAGFDVAYNEQKRKYTPEELRPVLIRNNPDIIIAGTEKYNAETLALCPNLKMISRAGVGVDGVDLKECARRGIIVIYTPAASTDAVAELTIGQMINALRNVQYVSGTWNRYIGGSLGQSTVGIFGCGRIGRAVIEKLQGLKPKQILVNDIDIEKMAGLPNCVSASKDEILAQADIVTLHIPLIEPGLNSTYDNHDFISKADLAKCKSTAILMNIARGGIINETALVEWLKINNQAKAVVDTYVSEPYNGELMSFKNVFLTPHLGSCTEESRFAMEVGAVKEALNFINNKDFFHCLVDRNLFSQCQQNETGKQMRLAIIGAGYVGLVSGACFAEIGHSVVCVDDDADKIRMLNSGKIPFFEPGLLDLVEKNRRIGSLSFSTSLSLALENADVVFICVGTPPRENGQANLKFVYQVAEDIGKQARKRFLVVTKSTVPVGTAQMVRKIIRKNYSGEFDVASCPEFLREGSALKDFMNPDRIVIGTDSIWAQEGLLRIHEKLDCPKVLCNLETGEMIKYAANAFLATKISFINEIANVCENVGAEVEQVAEGMGLDKRIGKHFLRAGIGYGGSCFPKDVRAVHHIAGQTGYPFQLLKAVVEVNNQQRWIFYKKIKEAFGCLENKVIAVWGLAFKADTDDVRESIAIDLIEKLIEDGAKVQAYDPQAMNNAKKILGNKIQYCQSAQKAAEQADCLLLLTDWDEFIQFDFAEIRNVMKAPLVIDGRNALNGQKLMSFGFRIIQVGDGSGNGKIYKKNMNFNELKIAIVGLGYVGLPLAVEFGKQLPIVGFDINEQRIKELNEGVDNSGEVGSAALQEAKINFTHNPQDLRAAKFIIIAVPTPIDGFKKPDLTAIKSSAEVVGKNLSPGSIVVYESTVYPGVTEDVCRPILEQNSGLKCGIDFKIGYSPERINPGDQKNTIDKIVKIVSGQDQETLDKVAAVYEIVCKAGVHKAPSIKVAEAAKVIENIQRDINIALINELSLIFHHIGVDTQDVLEAAGTKWNFHKYLPGLVGGHCIGVDPYYLTSLVEQLGYNPELILTARRINEFMPDYVAELMVKGLIQAGKSIKNAKVLVLGLTFKENVKDIRNSKVKAVIKKLKEYEMDVFAHDSLLDEGAINGFGAHNVSDLATLPKVDGVVLCVAHDQFKKITLDHIRNMTLGQPVLVDAKGVFHDTIKQAPDFIY